MLCLRWGGVFDEEQLLVNAAVFHPELPQRRLGIGDHAKRPTQPHMVDGSYRHQLLQEHADPLVIESPTEQLDGTRFP
ncbi:Uncharacterised protein [Mycobacteroides abscessus subsp. abscessus]|nr:Uncharacterised protein [Mycobacteroides abscessus subsp. abscessus]